MFSMNRLPTSARAQIVRCLVEGNSLRATSRLVGVSINTVTKLLVDVAKVCDDYADQTLRDLPCNRIEADEIWAFCFCKSTNVPQERKGEWGIGDVWTFTALDAESKLIVSWLVGSRDVGTATEFITDVADRIQHKVQLTTDGHKMYLDAVDDAFGPAVDYAMLVKHYGKEKGLPPGRYSPAECTGTTKRRITGNPDPRYVSTSYVERQNLSMRMGIRRFTRLTNGFSRKVENHIAAVALYFFHYNFCRPHGSLKTPLGYKRTPAMAAGVTDHIWSVEEIIALLDAVEAANPPLKRRKGGRPRKVASATP